MGGYCFDSQLSVTCILNTRRTWVKGATALCPALPYCFIFGASS